MKLLFVFICLSFSLKILASSEEQVCRAVLIKGDVKIKFPNGKIEDVSQDTYITEGSSIKTGEKSFVKLIFIDQSIMNLGINSLVKIAAFSKETPGIISLIRGQIRSQVSKNYMEMEDKNKSKLFIRTKTAAMGIRGTDFQVNFEDENEETTLVTYEGKIAMNKLETDVRDRELNQRELDKILERKERVLVVRGEVSNINRETRKIDQPLKLEKKVFENLMKKESPEVRIIERKEKGPVDEKGLNIEKGPLPKMENGRNEGQKNVRLDFLEKRQELKQGRQSDKQLDERNILINQERREDRKNDRSGELKVQRKEEQKEDWKAERKAERKDERKIERKDELKDEHKVERKDLPPPIFKK